MSTAGKRKVPTVRQEGQSTNVEESREVHVAGFRERKGRGEMQLNYNSKTNNNNKKEYMSSYFGEERQSMRSPTKRF